MFGNCAGTAIPLKVLDSYDVCGFAEVAEQPGNPQAGR